MTWIIGSKIPVKSAISNYKYILSDFDTNDEELINNQNIFALIIKTYTFLSEVTTRIIQGPKTLLCIKIESNENVWAKNNST